MQSVHLMAYQQLKREVAFKLREVYPTFPEKLSEWKGSMIEAFQDELAKTVNGRVSEKWFYTHLKSEEVRKLPRADMLDLLSRFVGYDSWQSFLAKQQVAPSNQLTGQKNHLVWKSVLVATVLLIGVGLSQYFLVEQQKTHYQVCLVDAYQQQKITKANLQVFWLKPNESPVQIACEQGCFQLETTAKEVKLWIKAAYFKDDTIVRKLPKTHFFEETVSLMPDDYALMIHYFSHANVVDWKRRKAQLEEIFAENAKIFQVNAQNIGMELYNKETFINKLTIPINSLKNIKVLETNYNQKGQISQMRFIQE